MSTQSAITYITLGLAAIILFGVLFVSCADGHVEMVKACIDAGNEVIKGQCVGS